MRRILYSYRSLIGVLKVLLYKIIFGKNLNISGMPHFDFSASLRMRSGACLSLYKGAVIGRDSLISVTNNAKMQIGTNSVIGFNNIITCRDSIIIGNNVSFGPGIAIFDHDHDFRSGLNYNEGGYTTAPIYIEDNVWLGSNVIILKGVTIGQGSVVAAGSVVVNNIPAGSIYRNKITPMITPIQK